IEDAIEVFGETGTVDIITETLNEIYGVSGVAWHQFELKEPVGLSIAQLDSDGTFNRLFADDHNIERTKEKLVEYVVDNAHEFEWKNVYNEGEYSGYWSCSAEQAFSQPVDNAVQALGISTTMNIIIETLEKFYNIHNDGESKESVNLKFSNLKDFLVDVDDDEDYYDDYDEDDYGYDDDYDGFYDEDDEDE